MFASKIQAPVNHPDETVQHLEDGERLKSRVSLTVLSQYAAVSNKAFIPLG
jgi:hypothetical protein